MDAILIVVTLAMAAVGLWRVKFWPKLLIAVAISLFVVSLICFGFAENGKALEYFSEFIWSKNFWLPFISLFSVSLLVHVARREKEILKDPQETASDAAFPWFLLAVASAFVVVIVMLALFFRFELPWFISFPCFIIFVAYAAIRIIRMDSNKRKQMLATVISIYLIAVAELIILISL